MGSALRFCIPQSIGKKLGEFWELIKPLVDFKYEVVQYLTLYNITTFTVVTASMSPQMLFWFLVIT